MQNTIEDVWVHVSDLSNVTLSHARLTVGVHHFAVPSVRAWEFASLHHINDDGLHVVRVLAVCGPEIVTLHITVPALLWEGYTALVRKSLAPTPTTIHA